MSGESPKQAESPQDPGAAPPSTKAVPERAPGPPDVTEGDTAKAGDELGFELYRQHSFIVMMAGRLRETADALEQDKPVAAERIKRGLDVHRAYLLEMHAECDARVAETIGSAGGAEVRRVLDETKKEPRQAEEFQRRVLSVLEAGASPGSAGARDMARWYREEANRLEHHHSEQYELVYARLDQWVPEERRRAVLADIRQFAKEHSSAEAALVAWSSQLTPASD